MAGEGQGRVCLLDLGPSTCIEKPKQEATPVRKCRNPHQEPYLERGQEELGIRLYFASQIVSKQSLNGLPMTGVPVTGITFPYTPRVPQDAPCPSH